VGWEEEYVAKIIRRYVGRAATTKAMIHQLNRAEKGERNLQNRPQDRSDKNG
jgi:hypothetical protein